MKSAQVPVKLAILHCRKSSRVCTGAACFRAFYDRIRSFAPYHGQEMELSAYFDCGGCEVEDVTADPNIREKLERLKKEGVFIIHVGICMCEHTNRKGEVVEACSHYAPFRTLMESYGFTVVAGTH